MCLSRGILSQSQLSILVNASDSLPNIKGIWSFFLISFRDGEQGIPDGYAQVGCCSNSTCLLIEASNYGKGLRVHPRGRKTRGRCYWLSRMHYSWVSRVGRADTCRPCSSSCPLQTLVSLVIRSTWCRNRWNWPGMCRSQFVRCCGSQWATPRNDWHDIQYANHIWSGWEDLEQAPKVCPHARRAIDSCKRTNWKSSISKDVLGLLEWSHLWRKCQSVGPVFNESGISRCSCRVLASTLHTGVRNGRLYLEQHSRPCFLAEVFCHQFRGCRNGWNNFFLCRGWRSAHLLGKWALQGLCYNTWTRWDYNYRPITSWRRYSVCECMFGWCDLWKIRPWHCWSLQSTRNFRSSFQTLSSPKLRILTAVVQKTRKDYRFIINLQFT